MLHWQGLLVCSSRIELQVVCRRALIKGLASFCLQTFPHSCLERQSVMNKLVATALFNDWYVCGDTEQVAKTTGNVSPVPVNHLLWFGHMFCVSTDLPVMK